MNEMKGSISRQAFLNTAGALAAIGLAGCAAGVHPDFGSKRLPHQLEIATEKNCPKAVDTTWSRPCAGGQARGDTCVLPGDWVQWKTSHTRGFKIRFKDESPMAEDCDLSTPRGHYACPVAEDAKPGEYEYGVKLTGCPDELDPRIIVGSQK